MNQVFLLSTEWGTCVSTLEIFDCGLSLPVPLYIYDLFNEQSMCFRTFGRKQSIKM